LKQWLRIIVKRKNINIYEQETQKGGDRTGASKSTNR
jgi:hypothetical protein